jgi:hypothetical protein
MVLLGLFIKNYMKYFTLLNKNYTLRIKYKIIYKRE